MCAVVMVAIYFGMLSLVGYNPDAVEDILRFSRMKIPLILLGIGVTLTTNGYCFGLFLVHPTWIAFVAYILVLPLGIGIILFAMIAYSKIKALIAKYQVLFYFLFFFVVFVCLCVCVCVCVFCF